MCNISFLKSSIKSHQIDTPVVCDGAFELSTITHQKFRKYSSLDVDCQTYNGVCLITCQNYHLQYVGETKRRFLMSLKELTYP